LALLRGAHKLLGTVNGKALEMLLVIVFTYRQHITRECHVRNIPLCYLQYAKGNKQIDHTYINCIHPSSSNRKSRQELLKQTLSHLMPKMM